MPKCEHHEDFIKLHDGLKDHIDRVEKTLDNRVNRTEDKVDKAFSRIDKLKEDLKDQESDYRETATYVKTLYRRFDELTTQMQIVVTKLDTYIGTMATVQSDTNSNTEFSKKGKGLAYEIIKWIVILALGYALNNQTP